MSKDKNKNSQINSTNNNTKKVEKKEEVVNATKTDTKLKETPKEKVTPPPAEDPTIQEVKAEVVDKDKKEKLPDKININGLKLAKEQRVSGDGYARLLDVAERHISKMKPGEPATIKMEQAFTYNLAWGLTKATIQAREEKLEMGIAVPNDDIIVQDVIETFNNLGVALEPHKVSEDGSQMTLQFKEIAKETEKSAKEEIKEENAPVAPDINPENWKEDIDAKNGLAYLLSKQDTPFPNRFNEALMKVRVYRKNQEKDEAKKETWDKINIGALFEDAVKLLGNKSTILMRGLCQGAVASLIADHNPIFAHSTVKYNLPVLSEEEVTDLIKSFISVKQGDTKLPIDESVAVRNGILEPSREFFLRIPKESELKVENSAENAAEVALAKKIMNKFKEAYKDEFHLVDPDYYLKVTNKMIAIRNLYVDKDAQFALYTEDEYPKAITSIG